MEMNRPTVQCLVILLTISVCWGSPPPIRCIPSERDSLVNFVKPIPLSTFGWDTQTDCCSWPGIGCDAATGHVIRLDLSRHGATFSLSPNSTLFHLSFLQFLDLSHNKLQSTSIPKEIAKLRELTVLNISSTSLGGIIPPAIGSLPKLRVLKLYSTFLSGKIPESLGNLSSLSQLLIVGSSIQGTIPDSLGNLRRLFSLKLVSNLLTGNIPISFAHLTRLRTLDLSGNSMSGKYPDFFASFPLLEFLRVSNHMAGSIPNSMGNLPSLKELWISQGLSGTIPASLLNLPNLEVLDLSYNKLEGPLPTNVRLDSKLGSLFLNFNNLTGKIPSWLFTRRLFHIALRNNSFTGPIEAFPKPNATILNFVDLGENRIRGPIPASLFQPNIGTIQLDGNELSGAIEWGTLKDMTVLSRFIASRNRELMLKNSMNALFNLPYLTVIDLEDCGVTEFPSFLKGLENLGTLYLDNNRMRGPMELGKDWKALAVLSASFNMLQGSLPTLPPMLFSLIVPHNNFTGKIPAAYVNLSHLDLSYNQLEGPIPNGNSFPKEVYIGNKGLCGFPLTQKCKN